MIQILQNSILAILGSALTLAAQSEEWSQFRGPGSKGIAIGQEELPARFGEAENLIWKAGIGPGHSSPCIWGNRIFLTSSREDLARLSCFDRETGELLWQREVEGVPENRLHRVNSAATPTPTTDGERVYAYFGSFGMICYDFAGEEQWRRPIRDDKNIFGTATSPILAEGSLIFCRDTNGDSFLESIDPKTGETRWHVDRTGFPSGWSTPVLWEHDGIKELLVYGAFRLSSYDPDDGEERWSVPG
ncbi:MAG: outer membrane protein assembly factor BamB family protein, partial [Planctomycetota bacterium]